MAVVGEEQRLRLAVNYALNRQRINEAACLGFCPPAGVIVPRVMDFALQAEPMPYDLPKAKQLLAEAGYPNGLDAGEFTANPGFPTRALAWAGVAFLGVCLGGCLLFGLLGYALSR